MWKGNKNSASKSCTEKKPERLSSNQRKRPTVRKKGTKEDFLTYIINNKNANTTDKGKIDTMSK